VEWKKMATKIFDAEKNVPNNEVRMENKSIGIYKYLILKDIKKCIPKVK
jgi:hypothetical protein